MQHYDSTLENNIWRENTEGFSRARSGGSTLRDNILNEISTNNYSHDRNHHQNA
jgi:parallel beta-helix repeat protein